jgi:Dolichyl-phosphate-mannose-protein mannosyltransferase
MPKKNPRARLGVDLIFFALLAMALLWTALETYGIGISPDSVGYLATARNIADGSGAITYDASPLINQPPLYPLAIAAIKRLLGGPPERSAVVLSMALLGLNMILAGLILRKYVDNGFTALLFTALVFYPLFAVSRYAWSEPLFVCLNLSAFLCLDRYFAEPRVPRLLHVALLVGLSTLTRYIGVTLAASVAISLLGFHCFRRDRMSSVLGRSALFFSLAIGPLGLWGLRNWALSGTFFGPRASSATTIAGNIGLVFETYRAWYMSHGAQEWIASAVALALAAACALALMRNLNAARAAQWSGWLPFAIYWLVYVAFLVVNATRIAFDPIDARLLSPVVVPMFVVFLALTRSAHDLAKPGRVLRRAIAVLIVALGVVLLMNILRKTAGDIASHRREGRGYNALTWRTKPLIHALRRDSLPTDCVFYSNDPWGGSYYLDSPVRVTPQKTYYRSPDRRAGDLAALRGVWPPEERACLLWFNSSHSHLYTLDELRTILRIEPLLVLNEEGVYFIAATSR